MSFDAEIAATTAGFEKAMGSLAHDFKHIRTGRASIAMIEHVHVDAYGSRMPIAQCASLTVPEPAQILVKPWDKGLLKAIEKALSEAQLGMMPQSDGVVIRLQVPPLSSERRKQLAAQAKEASEKCKVAMRNQRRDHIKAIETKGKAEKSPEDAVKKACEKVSDMLKQYETKADSALKDKTDDILKF
jgi:ribosome recycling factor